MSYLQFVSAGTSASGKTKQWSVQNLQGIHLGEIRWFAAWRKYTVFPDPGTTCDAECLHEIATFLEAETFRQKYGEAALTEEKRRPNCL
jgi:hypothetical protein